MLAPTFATAFGAAALWRLGRGVAARGGNMAQRGTKAHGRACGSAARAFGTASAGVFAFAVGNFGADDARADIGGLAFAFASPLASALAFASAPLSALPSAPWPPPCTHGR